MMVRMALPVGAMGVERFPDLLAVPGAPADAVSVEAEVLPEGMDLLGVSGARLQVCSNGANVKSPSPFWPVTVRPWTWYGPEAPGLRDPSGWRARVSG